MPSPPVPDGGDEYLDRAPDVFARLMDVLARAADDAALRAMIARAVCTHNDFTKNFRRLEGEYDREVERLKTIRDMEMSSLGLSEEQRRQARERPEGALADATKRCAPSSRTPARPRRWWRASSRRWGPRCTDRT